MLFGGPADWARLLSIATVIGAFMGVIGPFGSYQNDILPVRLAYWLGMAWAAAVLLGLIVRPIARLGPRLGFPALFSVAFGLLVAAAPIAVLAAVSGHAIWPKHVHSLTPLDWYGQTLIIAVPVVALVVLLERLRPGHGRPADQDGSGDEGASGPAQFVDRLPPRLGRDLLCLQMEDHYVRAHTPAGSDLILISLRQAVSELDGLEGLQVHRSWWVARAAVAGAQFDGRNCRLTLKGGLQAPVARNRIAALRAEGWLDPA